LEYQWQKVGGNLPSRHEIVDHGRVLNIPNVGLEHAGNYRCLVKREYGQATEGELQLSIDGQYNHSSPACFCKTRFCPLARGHLTKGHFLLYLLNSYGGIFHPTRGQPSYKVAFCFQKGRTLLQADYIEHLHTHRPRPYCSLYPAQL
jgi:hypothetical protein